MVCNVLLVDDHPIVRKGLSNFLKEDPMFQVIGDFDNGDFIFRHTLAHVPDLAVLDLSMPGTDGYAVAAQIKHVFPQCKLIAYTAAHNVLKSLQEAGFDGYVDKSEDPVKIMKAIKAVASGEKYFPVEDKKVTANDLYTKPEYLTSREVEIMKLIAKGYTNKEISRELFISDLTVKTHRRNIHQKTGSKNAADLIQFLLKLGL
jgi:DNA-binding NarL/FixJ family response regulator